MADLAVEESVGDLEHYLLGGGNKTGNEEDWFSNVEFFQEGVEVHETHPCKLVLWTTVGSGFVKVNNVQCQCGDSLANS